MCISDLLSVTSTQSCSYCEMVGSTLGCYSKGCTLRYHYLCAIEAGECQRRRRPRCKMSDFNFTLNVFSSFCPDCSLNEDNYSLRCPKHKVKKERLVSLLFLQTLVLRSC